MNAGTGTNNRHCRRASPLQSLLPQTVLPRALSKIEELADRVDRLLMRHDELKRTNALLDQQLALVTQERDSLRSRLNAARSRIDALLDRLPIEHADTTGVTSAETPGSSA